MGRRRKKLVDIVRDGTFRAREDEHLLLAAPPRGRKTLPWPGLERVRREFRAAEPDERRAVSLALQQGLQADGGAARYLGELQAELRKLGPPGSFEQLERFFPRFFRHYAGPLAGKPFHLAPFQKAFLREFWRRDRHGRRVYTVGLLLMPKGNGKTPLAAGLGTHALVSHTDAPEIYCLAGAKDQAGIAHEFARRNIEDGALGAWLVPNKVIECPEHYGEFEIESCEGDLGHGVNPTFSLFDELWQFRHRGQREAWNAHFDALQKRSGESAILGISQGGYDKQTLLGEQWDAAIAHPKLEVHNDGCLLILRDEESGFLFWAYTAPEDADIEDPKILRACNPAPWVSPRDLLRQLKQPGANELAWRRLHTTQWTKTQNAWLPVGCWARLRSDRKIPRGAEVYVGVDVGINHDTTAVTWARRLDDGRVAVRCHTFSARPNVPAHTFVPGGMVDLDQVEEFIAALHFERGLRVREVVADPRFAVQMLQRLGKRGLTTAPVHQSSAEMADAYQAFYQGCGEGRLTHDGDPILAAHVEAAAAEMTERGWKIRKLRSGPIDGCVSSVIAYWRAAIAGGDDFGVDWLDEKEAAA